LNLDIPFGVCAFLEENDFTGAVPGRGHPVGLNDNRAFEDQYRLIDRIVPMEFPRAALPDPGFPSMIQEFSIGLGVIFEAVFATSIRARELAGILSPNFEKLIGRRLRLAQMR
jgi:hypothetical protein